MDTCTRARNAYGGVKSRSTGCYVIMCFFDDSKYILDSGLSLFSLSVSVCTHTRQVEHQRSSRTGRVQKNHRILRENTIFNEHPVYCILHLSKHKQTSCFMNKCTLIVLRVHKHTFNMSDHKIIISRN